VAPFVREDQLLVCAAKGIELGTLLLPGGVIASVLGSAVAEKASFLSGPSFASEIAAHQPTCVTAASKFEKSAAWTQELFHAAQFRVYTSPDPIGLEVAGALKNVIAIAAGAAVGIGFQMNSQAALITRGLAEITRVGVAMGANPLTFKGLSGVGDLFLTCTSAKSRNYTVGYRLGKGETLNKVTAEIGSVAEGVATAKAAYELSRSLGVSTPIIEETYKVLYEEKPIAQAVMDLLTRDAKSELE
jgi:glycerol-3-phosphate dehydrogenase (NAD(P)+)